MIGYLIATFAVLFVAFVASLFVRARGSLDAKITDRFAPCPDSPNCVSSIATDIQHRIEPLHSSGDPESAWQHLKETVAKIPRTVIVVDEEHYLAAECRSRVFGFIDDLELSLNPGDGRIEVRSAARTGHSDLGVNRKRVEELRRVSNQP